MIQMESEPKQLVDPGVTEFWESGKTRKYYVNLANYDIQLHPGQYNLPQGGILQVSSFYLLDIEADSSSGVSRWESASP